MKICSVVLPFLSILGLIATHRSLELENPIILPFARSLSQYLVFSREDNTIKSYMSAFNKWERWANMLCLKVLPVNYTSVALYILSRIQMGEKYPSIKCFFYALKFTHNINGLDDPTTNFLVKSMFETAHRLCKVTVNKKSPVDIKHIHALYEALVHNSISLLDFRTMIVCLLGFCGFMRYSEIVAIRRYDILFCRGFLKIFIEKSKTDIYRDGKWLYISACDSKCCPVANLQLYLAKADIIDPHSDQFIIRAVTKFPKKKLEKLRETNKPLSYTSAREWFLHAVKKLGLNVKDFGLHSLRSGGASAAANAGVSDRLFKRHGRWRSETVKDGYVQDDVSALLLVSQSLGL